MPFLFISLKMSKHSIVKKSKDVTPTKAALIDIDSQIFDPKVFYELYELHNLAFAINR